MQAVAQAVHQLQGRRAQIAAAADAEVHRPAEQLLGHRAEQILGKPGAEIGKYILHGGGEFQSSAQLFVLFLLPGAGPDLLLHRVPQHGHGENVGHLVAAAGLENGVRVVVPHKHQGPAEKGKPHQYSHQAEHMVKGQKRQQLQAALIMLGDPGGPLENILVGQHLLGQLCTGVEADHLVHGGGGGGKCDLVFKNIFGNGRVVALQSGNIQRLDIQAGGADADAAADIQGF